jgi:hypothetical protein
VSPQPRPRSKKPRSEETEPEPEVLTPDAVWDDDDEELPEPLPARPDRRPLWALIAGITALWFSLTGALYLIILVAPFAVIYGFLTYRRLVREDQPQRPTRQAKWGFILGVLAVVLTIIQIVLFVVFFEWDKSADDLEFTDEKTVTTGEPGDEPSGEPEG